MINQSDTIDWFLCRKKHGLQPLLEMYTYPSEQMKKSAQSRKSKRKGFVEKSKDVEVRITHPEAAPFFTMLPFPLISMFISCRNTSTFLRTNKHLKLHITQNRTVFLLFR
jgi:hypothetical protein